jgi:hypothetical protein
MTTACNRGAALACERLWRGRRSTREDEAPTPGEPPSGEDAPGPCPGQAARTGMATARRTRLRPGPGRTRSCFISKSAWPPRRRPPVRRVTSRPPAECPQVLSGALETHRSTPPPACPPSRRCPRHGSSALRSCRTLSVGESGLRGLSSYAGGRPSSLDPARRLLLRPRPRRLQAQGPWLSSRPPPRRGPRRWLRRRPRDDPASPQCLLLASLHWPPSPSGLRCFVEREPAAVGLRLARADEPAGAQTVTGPDDSSWNRAVAPWLANGRRVPRLRCAWHAAGKCSCF